MEHQDVRIPDVQVIIAAAGSEVGVVSFYLPANVHDEAEVVTFLCEPSAKPHLVAILHQAIASFNAEDWYTVDGLDSGSVSDEGGAPFLTDTPPA